MNGNSASLKRPPSSAPDSAGGPLPKAPKIRSPHASSFSSTSTASPTSTAPTTTAETNTNTNANNIDANADIYADANAISDQDNNDVINVVSSSQSSRSSSVDSVTPGASANIGRNVISQADDQQQQQQPSASYNQSLANPNKHRVKKVNGKWVPPKITKEECLAARKYLKKEGMVQFLDKYLPESPRGSDILYAVVILGFFSASFDDDIDDEKNFMKIIKMLQRAMNKVLFSRSRLGTVKSIDDAISQIQNAKKILVLTGAGVSTSLGIPDFRSKNGIYASLEYLGLTDPQEVFDLRTFKEDPTIFYRVAHKILPPAGSFTPLHAFIKLLDQKGKLLRNYTQNIDNLEANAGISRDKVIQCHGSFASATCQTCGWRIDGTKIFKYIREMELPLCRSCYTERARKLGKNEDFYPKSFGVMKPDITFFGENLPDKFHDNIKYDVQDCDLLICIGTSLKVAPVSEIVNMVPEEIPQILINKDLVEHAEFDVSFLGYCDQVAVLLSDKLGWKLEHKDADKIRNSELTTQVIDEELGIFEIKDKSRIEKEIRDSQNRRSNSPTLSENYVKAELI